MELKFQCPECGRAIVSRRNKLCLYCGAELPAHLLFTPAEIEAHDRKREEEERKRKAQEKARQEQERERGDGDGGAGYFDFGTF